MLLESLEIQKALQKQLYLAKSRMSCQHVEDECRPPLDVLAGHGKGAVDVGVAFAWRWRIRQMVRILHIRGLVVDNIVP